MRVVVVAAAGYALNFWAWALLSPLGPLYRELLGLSAGEHALLVALPVLVGSIGRIPVGALTDRFGGRVMFPLISAATIVPVLFLGVFGQLSYAALLVGGFFLGIAGTAFAVGVPLVTGWFPPARRGTALGLYGIGMGGTAIAAVTTVPLWNGAGAASPFVITAIALGIYAVVSWLLLRDAPGHLVDKRSLVGRLAEVSRSSVTWLTSLLYALSFGGYVAFAVFLPTFLQTEYGLDLADAANRMAGFVIVAVLCRPLGGFLSDRVGPIRVLALTYAIVTLAALVLVLAPGDAVDGAVPWSGTVSFLSMAGAMGAGSGAVFAFIGGVVSRERLGTTTGIVGAAGGLGGFVPPLLLTFVRELTGSYAIALLLLAVASALCLLATLTGARSIQARRR
jgi:NNP family nitrate/nitrite transporter-like MFS transporter